MLGNCVQYTAVFSTYFLQYFVTDHSICPVVYGIQRGAPEKIHRTVISKSNTDPNPTTTHRPLVTYNDLTL